MTSFVKELEAYLIAEQAGFYRLAYSYLHNEDEALDAVQTAICRSLEKHGSLRDKAQFKSWFKRILINCCLDILRQKQHVSPTAAENLENIGYEDPGIDYQVSVPEIEAAGPLAQQINAAIQEKVDAHLAKARQDWADYQEAFLATGGTQAELAEREMNVIVDYEIKSQTDTRVSFVVTLAEGWVAAFEERYYYNLDLANNQPLTLEMLLGENWVQICNESIQRDIAASADETGFSYFFPPEEGGFSTVDADTTFYIRADGVPVVTFAKYEIAAGAAGIPEFPITAE